MTICNTEPQPNVKACADAVIQLRNHLRLTPRELAEMCQCNQQLVGYWESSRGFPSGHHLQMLQTIAAKHRRIDLQMIFQQTQRRNALEWKNRKHHHPPPDHGARQGGRESAFIEVLHLIDERCSFLRTHPSENTEALAHELELLKADIRALPVIMPSRRRSHGA